MDRLLKKKWVRALRSGKIPQTPGYLYHEGAMCCLGVLAHVQGCRLEGRPRDENETTNLPQGFNAGLTPKQRSALAHMNDDLGKSFKEIADYIEANIRES